MKVAALMLAVAIGASAENPAVPSGLTNRLNEQVSRALWWHRYWNSPQAPPFQGGVDGRAVRFTDRWVILIAGLKVAIAAVVNPEGTVGPLVSVDESPFYGGSNTAALKAYERLFLQSRHDLSCVPVQTAPAQRKTPAGQGNRLPAARGCIEAPKRISGYDLSITVDPQAAARSVIAKDHDDVIAVVRTWAQRYYPELTGKAEIPIYSSDDPAVYVFMRSSDDQVQGILIVQREFDGGMTAGKFLDHPDSIRRYVDRIRRQQPIEVDWALARGPGGAVAPGGQFHPDVLMAKAVYLVGWQVFWQGAESFPGRYVPLAPVKAGMVRSPGRAAVFIADLGITLTFSEDASGGLLMRYGEWRAGDTNQAAAKRYIDHLIGGGADAECVPLIPPQPGGNAQTGTLLPQQRVCNGSAAALTFIHEEREIRLPEGKPPLFDGLPALQRVLPRLRAAIRMNIGQYLGSRIQKARVLVPHFSIEDPYVFVYVDFGVGRKGGIVRFGPEADGSWSGGKLILAGPPNDAGRTVSRIQAHAMETVAVP